MTSERWKTISKKSCVLVFITLGVGCGDSGSDSTSGATGGTAGTGQSGSGGSGIAAAGQGGSTTAGTAGNGGSGASHVGGTAGDGGTSGTSGTSGTGGIGGIAGTGGTGGIAGTSGTGGSSGTSGTGGSNGGTAGTAGTGGTGATGGSAGTAGGGGECADWNPLKRVLWGDLHDHTAYSIDAYSVGNTTQGPAEAYAFAKGAPVPLAAGGERKLDRPLDFLAVTDHSEFFDTMGHCTLPGPNGQLNQSPYCVSFRGDGFTQGTPAYTNFAQLANQNPQESVVCSNPNVDCQADSHNTWLRTIEAATAANDPCAFTSFNAYEYSGNANMKNMHRNVIFGGDSVPYVPIDYIHYPTVEGMLTELDAQCQSANGCDAVVIPHSANDSQGEKWLVQSQMESVLRGKWEILTEIYQHKGASECLNPTTDPADNGYDEGCEFELATVLNGAPNRDTDVPGYVRSGLSKGIVEYSQNGGALNPFHLGIIASTDTHNTTPGAVEENQWVGHTVTTDDTPAERLTGNISAFGPGGLAAVWAEENTRTSIFAALKRRETYGTSGPRMTVRFYQFTGNLDPCSDPNFPAELVASGAVPMGGTIPADAVQGSKFVVFVQKDSTNIAEVDLVQSTVVGGVAVETVTRQMAANQATGAAEMCVLFTPSFSSNAPTYWYARVLEIPTPRWSHYDCQLDPTDCGTGDRTIQERAWTSPIWNLP